MAITASEARKNLFPLIEQVNDDQEPVEIVSRKGTAYLVSEAQYRSLTETAHLLRSPANAERLMRSVTQIEGGGAVPHDLIDAQ
jgi:antitoxin YefM